MAQTYFYDQQVRKFLYQLIRMFSEFQVEYGTGDSTSLVRIPVKYGDPSLQAASIQSNNSENTMISAPSMALYINQLKYDVDRKQNPTFVGKVNVRTRKFDEGTGLYLPQQANAYSVERLMPVPYMMTIRLDIYTTNTTQKLEILEQILALFNPILELQSTSEYFDWGSLTYIKLTDVTWSSVSVPIGTEIPMDIATLEFEVPIWISLPARVKKLGAVFKVITSMFDSNNLDSIADFVAQDDLLLGTRQIVTFNNYNLFISNSNLNLLFSNQVISNANINYPGTVIDDSVSWPAALSSYGNVIPGISEIRISSDTHFKNEISANIAFSSDDTQLIFNIDPTSLPQNTLPEINGVIDPLLVGPNAGLPVSTNGQSYILSNNVGNSTPSWGNITAEKNDIITYNTEWQVSFDSSNSANIEYVQNSNTNTQLVWTGSEWDICWEGKYDNDHWRLII